VVVQIGQCVFVAAFEPLDDFFLCHRLNWIKKAALMDGGCNLAEMCQYLCLSPKDHSLRIDSVGLEVAALIDW
jgi:hypothetical protein